MKDIVYEKDCIILNVQLAIKRLEEGDIEMAAHRAEDARRSIEEMLKQIKKAN